MSLAIRAHSTGAVDFSKYDRYDWRSRLSVSLVFDSLEDHTVNRLNEMTYQWHAYSGQPVYGETSGERVEFHRKEAKNVFALVGKSLLPWYKKWYQDEGKNLRTLWEEFQQRSQDPAYAEYLSKARKLLRSLGSQDTLDYAGIHAARVAQVEKQKQRRRRHARAL